MAELLLGIIVNQNGGSVFRPSKLSNHYTFITGLF